MKRLFIFAYGVFVFSLTPALYAQFDDNDPAEEYVADDEGYDEIDDEFYDPEEEDTPLEEMDPIYQDDICEEV